MKRVNIRKMAGILCALLIAALALTGCGAKKTDAAPAAQSAQTKAGGDVGEGQKAFQFTVVDKEGKETAFTVRTDKDTVGDALLETGLIAGEAGQYGLYVKTVNGVTADYDVDKTYWAFYVNGQYASSGVDTTAIEEGATYMFKVEK